MTSSSAKIIGLSRLERASPGPTCIDILSPRVSMLLEVAWTVLVSLASLSVEASAVPLSGSLIAGTEACMHVAGYSWKTNEYGLTVDSITEFHLVSPNGTQIVVTEADKDLWFALKVCLNDGDEGITSS